MEGHDLSGKRYSGLGNHAGSKVAIAISKWNKEITEALFDGAFSVLVTAGVKKENIFRFDVPGAFELPQAANSSLALKPDAVICLGCVIQGETRHFDFICNAVSYGAMEVGLRSGRPVIFGVLTTDNFQQANERAGGKLGNKGEEAAIAALEMIDLNRSIKA